MPGSASIGGSGLYEMDGLEGVERDSRARRRSASPPTRWCVGTLGGVDVVFLPRHGRGHRILPNEINFRANVYALKKLGVEWLLARRRGRQPEGGDPPGDIVVVRISSSTAPRPRRARSSATASSRTSASPIRSARRSRRAVGARRRARRRRAVHEGGTYVVHGGAAVLDARRVAALSRSWGVDVIGMTNLPEAKLAREAEICFATLALSPTTTAGTRPKRTSSSSEVLRILEENVGRCAQAIVARGRRVGCPRATGCAVRRRSSTRS